MAIRTRLTETFALRYPITLAPMGAVSGGKLAAAVTNAGGLGLVGGGYGDPEWVERELALAASEAQGAWGVGFITWSLRQEVLERALAFRPRAVMLSFGDPFPFVPAIKAAGAKLICQVQDLEGARGAVAAGADFIVAQGTEAGGHGASRATLPLVPAVMDAVRPIPVLAAGGIADGRGLAAALMLGAEGVLIGTRFYASHEALGPAAAKERIVAAAGCDTARTRVFDIVRGYAWPEPYTGRCLRNRFLDRWEGREAELAAVAEKERAAFSQAQQAGDCDTAMVWAGEAVDLIDRLEPAGELTARIGAEAEALLRKNWQ